MIEDIPIEYFKGVKAKELLDVLPARLKPAELKLDTQEEFILKLVEIEKDTPACCDPSTETYWSM